MTVLPAFSNRTVGLAMIQTTHTCRKCGSADIVKNGHSASGSQQCHCKDCGAYLVLDPDSNEYSEEKTTHPSGLPGAGDEKRDQPHFSA